MTSVVVVTAGVTADGPSSSRLLADRLGDSVAASLAMTAPPATVRTFELREYALDIARNVIQGFPSPELEALIESLTTADGAVFVTPIFAASYSGLLKMFLDILEPDSIAGLPVLIGATGGTERHSLALDYALRPVLTYLRAIIAPTGVFAATRDWGSSDQMGPDGLSDRIERAGAELASLMQISEKRTRTPQLS